MSQTELERLKTAPDADVAFALSALITYMADQGEDEASDLLSVVLERLDPNMSCAYASYRRWQRDALVRTRDTIDKILEEDYGDSNNAVRSGSDPVGSDHTPEDV
jgi:hypothetical protein